MTKNIDISMKLSDRIALVTGASRGIGKEIAKRLAHAGAHVIISSRKYNDCLTVAEEIIKNGGSAEAISCNVGCMESLENMFLQINKNHKKLDILVNNAATNPYFGHILDTQIEAFEKTVNVNLRGYFYACIFGAKIMKKNGGGTIVNVSSVNALVPAEKQGIYSITKSAVAHMTKAFAKECGSLNIRVNAVLPGLTKTAFTEVLFKNKEIYGSMIQHIPLKRHAMPSEIAGAVHYLVSDAASYTTGEFLVVDGGLTI